MIDREDKIKEIAKVIIVCVVGFAAGCFTDNVFDDYVKEQNAKKQRIQQKYLDSIHNRGYVTGSVYDILKQNTK